MSNRARLTKTEKFRNHSASKPPSKILMASHYIGFDKNKIDKQTGSANWFIAELIASSNGGSSNNLYLIYNPTNSNGDPVVSTTTSAAKLCYAPEPPFNTDDTPSLNEIYDLLKRLVDDVKILKNKIK